MHWPPLKTRQQPPDYQRCTRITRTGDSMTTTTGGGRRRASSSATSARMVSCDAPNENNDVTASAGRVANDAQMEAPRRSRVSPTAVVVVLHTYTQVTTNSKQTNEPTTNCSYSPIAPGMAHCQAPGTLRPISPPFRSATQRLRMHAYLQQLGHLRGHKHLGRP